MASILWMAIVGLLMFQDVRAEYRPIVVTVEGYELQFPYDIQRDKAKTALVTFLKTERAKPQSNYKGTPETDAAEISASIYPRDPSLAIAWAVAAALSAPLITFILGVLLFWILAGFKRDPVAD
ncbi:hypothetical protein [Tardiphaga sp. 367_B4_N1_1]|uniref:hypothetical protein n=1 Tax=Tardiphaga sp. 367_B4_N1_1 TaxID=3240777 RepID=UPI003F272AB2